MVTGARRVTPKLVRGLGQLDATMIVVGILIGSGIFMVSAESSRLVGAPGWLLAVWALAGLMTVTGSQCCAELASSWWDSWANGWTPQHARPDLDVTGGLARVMLLGLAMVGPLFSQSGWNNVTFTGGEVRDPGRNLPGALVKGTAIVVTLYLLANLAYVVTLPRTVTTDAAGMVAYGDGYTQLLEYIISADLVFYSLMVGAVIILRRKAPDAERPYRTVGYPVTPFIYIFVAALLILDLAYLAPTTSGIGFLLVLSGIPVYLVWRSRASRRSAVEPWAIRDT